MTDAAPSAPAIEKRSARRGVGLHIAGAEWARATPGAAPRVLNRTSERLGSRPGITNWAVSTPQERRAPSAIVRHGRQPSTLSAAPSGRNSATFRTPSASAPSPHSTQRIGGGPSVASRGTSVTPRITASHRIGNQLNLRIVYYAFSCALDKGTGSIREVLDRHDLLYVIHLSRDQGEI